MFSPLSYSPQPEKMPLRATPGRQEDRFSFGSLRKFGNLDVQQRGQNLTQLTFFGKGQAGTPQWSPDGSQIAFDYRAEGRADVYVVNVAGGVPRRMTTESSDDSVPVGQETASTFTSRPIAAESNKFGRCQPLVGQPSR
jgi:dipeptidyl aminopeptidase/acylaminoacyl peptidase